jgi:hypothetical protein
MHVNQQVLGAVVDGLQRRARLLMDSAADREVDAFGWLSQVHGELTGDRHEGLLLGVVPVTLALAQVRSATGSLGCEPARRGH